MVIFITPCFAQMTVGYTDFPPYTYIDETGKVVGTFHDQVIKVLQEAGFDIAKDFIFKVIPSKRLFADIISGAVTINVGIQVPILKDQIYFGTIPFLTIVTKAYFIGDKQPISSKGQFAGKSIISIRGFSFGDLLAFWTDPNNKCDYKETGTHESALKMLQVGRGDYLVDYSVPIERELEKNNVVGIKSSTISTIPVYFIVSKAVPNGEALMNKIDVAHKSLVQKGIIKPN